MSVSLSSSNASRPSAKFRQHLVVSIDFPTPQGSAEVTVAVCLQSNFSDLLCRPPQCTPMSLTHIAPTWKSQSAVSPLFFSAFKCHPDTENLAPVFVVGFDSADTGVWTEYTCHCEETCEIPLYINTDVGQAVSLM